MTHPVQLAIMAIGGGSGSFLYQGSAGYTITGIATLQARIRLDTNGGGSDDFSVGTFSGWWAGYPVSGIGTGKYVRLQRIVGDPINSGLNENQWYEITSQRSWGYIDSVGGTVYSGTFELEFGTDGSTVDYTSPQFTMTVDTS